jgi:hypothetical protein
MATPPNEEENPQKRQRVTLKGVHHLHADAQTHKLRKTHHLKLSTTTVSSTFSPICLLRI